MAAADRIEITVAARAATPRIRTSRSTRSVAAHIITAAQSIVARNVADRRRGGQPVRDPGRQHGGFLCSRARRAGRYGPHVHANTQDIVEQRLTELADVRALGGEAKVCTSGSIRRRSITSAGALRGATSPRNWWAGQRGPQPRAQHGRGGLLLHAAGETRLLCAPGAGRRCGGCCLHNSRYDFNDAVIPFGAAFFLGLAERGMPFKAS